MKYNNFISPIFKNVLISFLLITSACGGQSTAVNIRGTINGSKNKLIIVRDASHDMISTIDSTRANTNGDFSLNFDIASPQFVLLQVEGEREPIILLVEPDENVVVNGELGNLARNYTVRGSKGSSLVRDLNFRLNEVVTKIDSLSSHFRSNREHPRFDSIKSAVDSAYFVTIHSHKQFTIDFIKSNRYSLASILALYQQYDQTRPVLNSRDDFELFKLVDSVLFPLYSSNPLVSNLHSNVKKIDDQLKLYDKRQDMLVEGDKLPNIKLPLLNGDTINLSDVKSRFILVDFWATWCNECVPNNKIVKEIYDKYSAKGFQIVQISLDDNKDYLKRVVENDSIPWIVVADFLQWDSPIVNSLSINSIPSNYLIDRFGVVQARNITGKELQEVLNKLLP